MKHIGTAEEFGAFADEHKIRLNWHEPDEQDITARFVTGHAGFDNAMGTDVIGSHDNHYVPPGAFGLTWEHCVVFSNEHRDLAIVNLANLCAWASLPHRQGAVKA